MSQRVDIKTHSQSCDAKSCTCIPPQEKVVPSKEAEYACKPIPPGWIPPVGENYMKHHYHNPNCVRDAQTWVYQQIPKRICGQLVGQADTPVLGWGVHFQECWNWAKFGYLGFWIFILGSLIF